MSSRQFTEEDPQIQQLQQKVAVMKAELRQKKQASMSQQWLDCQPGGLGGLGPLALQEIQKQTQVVLNMQKSLMKERQRFEEEKRREADRRQHLQLQDSLDRLQRQLQAKQGININPPISIKDRLGPRNKEKVSVFSRIKKQETQATQNRGVHHTGFKRKFAGSDYVEKKPKKKSNYTNSQLPDDLVLTNITAQGPKKARARIEYHSLPEELVLTDLTEEGPKPRVSKIQEDDDRVVMEEEENLSFF